jgi:hypothetical protein
MATEQGAGQFQVTHDSLRQATNILPDNVNALGDTRQTLTSRSVPASAFGEVDASAQAGQVHADTVTAKADQLTKSQGRLDGIIQNIGKTTDQTGQMDDQHARRQDEQNVQLAQAAGNQSGQRDKALAVLSRISKEHPTSVATVAKRPLEDYVKGTEAWGRNWARNVQAGQIGDHYERDVADTLALPPTNENLRSLAETETKFWQSPRGSTVGGWFSADWRYGMLVEARTDWLNSLPAADATRIRQELGLP